MRLPMGNTVKLSVVGARHARDDEAQLINYCPNIAGAARSYGVIVLNLMALPIGTLCRALIKMIKLYKIGKNQWIDSTEFTGYITS